MQLEWPGIWVRFRILCRGFDQDGTSALCHELAQIGGVGGECVTKLAVCLLDVFD